MNGSSSPRAMRLSMTKSRMPLAATPRTISGLSAVEGAIGAQREATALWRVRVDVGEVREAGRLFRGAVERDAVRRLGLQRGRRD